MPDKFQILVNDDTKMVGIAPISQSAQDLLSIPMHEEEKREYALISNEAYKYQWLSARRLAQYCKQLIKKEKVNEILKNEVGRPYLKESSLHVSLSHNQNMTAVMFSIDPCGIDVELYRDKIIRIQQKFCTENELKKYGNNIEKLTLIWSAKESIYKMLGISGLIFKEQINCEIEQLLEKGHLKSEVIINSQKTIHIDVNYQVFDNELVTFCELRDSF